MAVSRRSVVAGAGAAVFVGAGAARALDGDMTIGDPAAPVQLIEYASLTCSHCAAFHAEAFPRLKADYIDTRRIGFTLREFPTPPAPVAFAMFQLARCGGASPAVYFDRCGVFFAQQRAILGGATMGAVRDALLAIGRGWGLSDDAMIAAMRDDAGVARVQATVADGFQRYHVESTPTLILNERPLQGHGLGTVIQALDAALAG